MALHTSLTLIASGQNFIRRPHVATMQTVIEILIWEIVCPAKNLGNTISTEEQAIQILETTVSFCQICPYCSAVLWKCFRECQLMCPFIFKIVFSSNPGLQVQIITF